MELPLYTIDAFTDRPFAGNPAAVCLLDRARPDAWMQAVAAEMNLSETAFVLPEADAWNLRWFTPKTEVDLCGHATLASAHILWQTNRAGHDRAIAFQTRSGTLLCSLRRPWIEMDFPSEPPVDAGDGSDLLAALKQSAVVSHHRNRMDHLVELADEQKLRALQPDMRLLAALPMRGVIVTARSEDPQFDFVSRFFAPAVGVPEDPVTGSAHCCLAPYWCEKLGKTQMVGFQASSRGGIVHVAVRGNRVSLSGQAVTVLRAQLSAD